MAPTAEKTNEKLFPVFRKNLLSNELETYVGTASKLSAWLSNPKAYYAQARPVIVELLEIAYAQVQRHNPAAIPNQPFHITRCPPETRPWADPYAALVHHVARFVELFPEPDLRAHVQALIQTIDLRQAPGLVSVPAAVLSSNPPAQMQHRLPPVAAPSPVTSLTQVRPSPVAVSPPLTPLAPAPLPQMHPIHSPAALSPFVTPVAQIAARPPPLAMSSSTMSYMAQGQHLSSPLTTSPPITPTLNRPPVTVPAQLQPVHPHPSTQVNSPAPSIAGPSTPFAQPAAQPAAQPKPRTKEKKKIIIEEDFILADLAWFKDGKKQQAAQAESTATTPQSTITPNAGPIGSATPRGQSVDRLSVHSQPQTPAFSSPRPPSVVKMEPTESTFPEPKSADPIPESAPIPLPSTEMIPNTHAEPLPSVIEYIAASSQSPDHLMAVDEPQAAVKNELHSLTENEPLVQPEPSADQLALGTEVGPAASVEHTTSFVEPLHSTENEPPVQLDPPTDQPALGAEAELAASVEPITGCVEPLPSTENEPPVQPDPSTDQPALGTKVGPTTPVEPISSVKLLPSTEDEPLVQPEPSTDQPALDTKVGPAASVERTTSSIEPLPSTVKQKPVESHEQPNEPAPSSTADADSPPSAVLTSENDALPLETHPQPLTTDSIITPPVTSPPSSPPAPPPQIELTHPRPPEKSPTPAPEAPPVMPSAEVVPMPEPVPAPTSIPTPASTDRTQSAEPSDVPFTPTKKNTKKRKRGPPGLKVLPDLPKVEDDANTSVDAGDSASMSSTEGQRSGSRTATPGTTKEPFPARHEETPPREESALSTSVAPADTGSELVASTSASVKGSLLSGDLMQEDMSVPAEEHMDVDLSVQASVDPPEVTPLESQIAVLKEPSNEGSMTSPACDPLVPPEERSAGSEAANDQQMALDEQPDRQRQVTPQPPLSEEPRQDDDAHPADQPDPDAAQDTIIDIDSEPKPKRIRLSTPLPDTTREDGELSQRLATVSPVRVSDREDGEMSQRSLSTSAHSIQSDAEMEDGEVLAQRRRRVENVTAGPPGQADTKREDAQYIPVVADLAGAVKADTEDDVLFPVSVLFGADMSAPVCAQGSLQPQIEFSFEVTADQAALLSQWTARYDSPADVTNARCLSFACYPFDLCLAQAHENPSTSFEDIMRSVHTLSWPRDRRLWAVLENDKGRRDLPLSPPFICNTECTIDLTRSVAPGKNTLRVFQLRDYSEYVFVLHMHSPTTAQLQELQEYRASEEQWHGFLQSIGKFEPLNLRVSLPRLHAASI